MELSELKAGDKVRITLDLDVLRVDLDGEIIFDQDYISMYPREEGVVSVEMQPAPPRVFGPGDLLSFNDSARYLILGFTEDESRLRYFSFSLDRELQADIGHFSEANGYSLITSAGGVQ